jgi:hypothetical protein
MLTLGPSPSSNSVEGYTQVRSGIVVQPCQKRRSPIFSSADSRYVHPARKRINAAVRCLQWWKRPCWRMGTRLLFTVSITAVHYHGYAVLVCQLLFAVDVDVMFFALSDWDLLLPVRSSRLLVQHG